MKVVPDARKRKRNTFAIFWVELNFKQIDFITELNFIATKKIYAMKMKMKMGNEYILVFP